MDEKGREKEIFREYLERKKLKWTNQRAIILEAFLKMEGHIRPEEFYLALRENHPTIGISTVYRTLKLFSRCNLAREMQTPEGATLFEHKFQHPHHDHFYCVKCGKYLEFYDESLEKLQEEIARQHGFEMKGHRLEISGICRECRESGQ